MLDWIRSLLDCRRAGEPAVLVTVAAVRGSAPRAPGARMVVTRDRQYGTIGGGNLEWQAVAIARDRLAVATPAAELRRFALGASLGQCCGGAVNLLFDTVLPSAAAAGWLDRVAEHVARDEACVVVGAVGPAAGGMVVVTPDAIEGTLGSVELDAAAAMLARDAETAARGPRLVSGPHRWFVDPIAPPAFTIALFGAGHVGRALVAALAQIPCRVLWIDPRADEFPPGIAEPVRAIVSDDPVAEVAALPAGSYVVVMTHNHQLDEALAWQILQRDDFAWFGLIGSATKRRRFTQRLAARGADPARLAAMACPIGIEGIPGKEPGVVAIAVAAQLLQLRAAQLAVAAPYAADAAAAWPDAGRRSRGHG
ncbi:MAG: xanthine dehydrogenase accessory protein XdhC [Lautropia sp.]